MSNIVQVQVLSRAPVSPRWRVLIGLISTAAVLPSAEFYSVRDLGAVSNLSGRDDGGPRQINRAGQIAAANVTGGVYRAFLYGGAWTNLGTLGGTESLASGVNALGRVVGRSLIDSGVTRAFLWTPGGTDGVPGNPQMLDLGVLPGGTNSEAVAINSSGQITGYSQNGTNDRAFRYDSGTMMDIGALLGRKLPYSYGLAINDAGHVVGTAYTQSFILPTAFFYNGTTAVELQSSGYQGASALAISNGDHIAGYLTTSNAAHAFRHFGGITTDLGTLGGHYSYGIGINNSNVIVGGSFIDAEDLVYHAFVATNNELVDLNDLLDATGDGWTLTEARAINDTGQITGVGIYGGQLRAFLLTPSSAAAAPAITSATPTATGFVGTPYSFQVTAAGNPAPTFSATGLPTGLSINPTSGLISGTPTATGTFNGAITAANGVAPDATQAFSITISAAPPTAPTITGIRLSGLDVQVSFTTVQGASYTLAGRDDVASGAWDELVTGIAGTGGTITVTNVGALALPKHFYRARINAP